MKSPPDGRRLAVDNRQQPNAHRLVLLVTTPDGQRLRACRVLTRDPVEYWIVHRNFSVTFEVAWSMPSRPATCRRARCNLTRNAAFEQPAATAASRGDKPSQATSSSASRSCSLNTRKSVGQAPRSTRRAVPTPPRPATPAPVARSETAVAAPPAVDPRAPSARPPTATAAARRAHGQAGAKQLETCQRQHRRPRSPPSAARHTSAPPRDVAQTAPQTATGARDQLPSDPNMAGNGQSVTPSGINTQSTNVSSQAARYANADTPPAQAADDIQPRQTALSRAVTSATTNFEHSHSPVSRPSR